MSENSNSVIGNSWTVLTPEVKKTAGFENVGPAAEGTKFEGDPACPTAPTVHTDLLQNSTEGSSQESEQAEDPLEPHQVKLPETSEGRAQLNAAQVNEDPSSACSTVEDLSSWTPDHEEQDALTGHSESPVSLNTDVDSFSDSYTHISSASGASTHPASGRQEGEEFKSEEESHLKKTITEDFKPDVELLKTKEEEGDGLRKRKISHLGSLDQGKTEAEDDEEDDEEFQAPQKEEEKILSLNKCILAAVILLGLGTIFFSGVLMDTDDEGDVDVIELKDPANKWLNPEVSKDAPLGLEPPDILSKQANDDQQILVLQAQLQQHQGDLKAVQHLAEEGEKERVRREELEKDYQRIKDELDRLPALQKELEQENERMKEESERAKKELEALPSLHRELEHLRAKVSQLTQSTGTAEHVHPVAVSGMPSSGNIMDVPPIEPQDKKHVKYWDKMSEEKESSRGEQEGKKKKSGKKDDGKQRRERVTEEEHVKEQKDLKKDKSNPNEGNKGKSKQRKDERERKKDKRREDGKMGKEKEEKKAFKEWDEKKDKNWKKDRHEAQDESRKDKKDRKDTGKKKVKEDKEREWKERGERKDWKERGERRDWKERGERKDWKERGERKDWKERGERKDRKEKKEWKNDKQSGGNDQKEWKEKKKELKGKDEWKGEKEWIREKSDGKFDDKTEKKWKGEKDLPKEFAEDEVEENHWREKKREWPTDEEWKREERKIKAHYHKHEGKKSHNEKEKLYKDEKEKNNDERHRYGQTSSHHHNIKREQEGQDHENYWSRQREKIQDNHRLSKSCSDVADCARVEGLSPVSLHDFEILLQSYLNKIQYPEDQTSSREELSKLVKEFFTDGVFAHDQMPFSEFVEDVADILEDMADGEESDGEESEEDDDDEEEEEMEEFEREAMEMFALSEDVGKVEKKGDRKKESGKMKGWRFMSGDGGV